MVSYQQLSLKIKFWLGSLFYATYAPQSWVYSRWRDRVEREAVNQVSPPDASEVWSDPGKLIRAEAIQNGAYFYFDQAELEVYFLTPDFVRLDWKPNLAPIPYGIARQAWENVATQLEEASESWMVSSQDEAGLRVTIAINGGVTFTSADGKVLREDLPPQRQGEAWTHQAKLRSEEHIYGLGERAARLNLRSPQPVKKKGAIEHKSPAYRMWNFDAAGKYDVGADPLYIGIPVYLGLHQQGNYLVFYENSFDANFSFDDLATAAFTGGALRYYFTAGSVTHLVERYTELTGRSPLPARWALGYHQSHWGYRTEEAVRLEYQNFEAYDLPLSAIHLDIDVQVGFRAFSIDPDRFPKLALFTQELATHDVRFITILNPGVKYSRKSNLFLEGRILDAFCKLPNGELVAGPVWPGWCVFPDFTNSLVRRWWSRQYEYLLDVGVAGFWHDMNEPAAFVLWGDRSLPPRATQHWMEGRRGDHREAHNLYGLLQAQAGYESLRHYRPNQRPFIVSRAGWAGLQRYAWTWTGDVECTWTALKQTIATVVGLGLSGVPYSGPDIGGFQGNPSAELYLRWFQMSSFLTFCRTHSSNNAGHRAPWTYGEPTLSIIRQFLRLRYQLMPYFYTLSWEASQKGYPPVRPVFWAVPEDATLWGIDDAFLLGEALLVCPIFEEGGRSRQVTLPSGNWYHFWDDTLFVGGGEVTIEAPLEQVPLLVKAGSILPMEQKNCLTLHLYPPVEGTTERVLYSDAGDGYGDSRLDRFQLSKQGDEINLTWEQQGAYPFPYKEIRAQPHGIQVNQIWIDEQEVNPESCIAQAPFSHLRLTQKFTNGSQ